MDKEISAAILSRAKKLGADYAEILYAKSESVSASSRFAKLEKFVQAENITVDVRVFVGKSSAVISTNSMQDLFEDELLEKAVFAANNSPEEQYTSLPQDGELCENFEQLDIYDDTCVSHNELIENAKKCESIILENEKITNSEGAESSFIKQNMILAKSNGFFGEFKKSLHSLQVVALAQDNNSLEQSYAFSQSVFYKNLKTPKEIANEAIFKTVRKLGARKVKSCKVPVVFDRSVARQLLCSFLDAVNGASIARGTSFLNGKLHEKIFTEKLNIIDCAKIERGIRSVPFDADGIESQDTYLVKDGILNSYLLNVKYANQLGLKSTANAHDWNNISCNNACVEKGEYTFDEIICSIKNGLYVTEVMGNGLNMTTGNYSQGAVGLWIENGEIAYPVNEITVAGNLIDMFTYCDFACDLVAETGIDSPSIRFDELVVGGI